MKDHPTPARGPAPQNDSPEGEEVAHYSEATVTRVFRWSAVAVVVIATVVGAGIYLARRQPAVEPAKVTPLAAPMVRQMPATEPPTVKFTAITREAGIDFAHNNGASGEKLLPESMGGGVAFFDFDNDGDQDLLFVNSTSWPGKIPAGKPPTTHALYRNDTVAGGPIKFTNVTAGSGLDVSFYGMGAACGDFDNDGRVDLFLTGVGGNHLLKNLGGGQFKDITTEAGVGGAPDAWSTSATWLDYDNDGRLDLFVCNYVRWSREIDLEVGYKLVGVGRAYGPPMNFQGAFASLYHNEGHGRFADVSAASGVQVKNSVTGVPAGKALGVAPVDLDSDGWIDLVIANDTVPNFVFRNQRDGTFQEIGALTGVAFDANGQTRGAMGIDVARFRNDSNLGIVIGNFANEMTALYVTDTAPQPGALPSFTDAAIAEGIGPASRLPLKFGIFFFDYDLDGRLDVLTANGHLEEEINKVQASQRYRQSAQLFWNTGLASGSTFTSVGADKAGADLFQPIVGRGSAFADLDGDGDLEVVLTQTGGAPLLLRNDQQLGHHWARFQLVGQKSNRDAIGAWITVRAGGRTCARQVVPTRSYMSQSELPVTIGLGQGDKIESVEILWPGRVRQTVAPDRVRVDQVNVIEQE